MYEYIWTFSGGDSRLAVPGNDSVCILALKSWVLHLAADARDCDFECI